MKWMKWHHKWNSGSVDESECDWIEVDEHPGSLRDTVNELAEEYRWSDNYRGINYELADTPDPEWLTKRIAALKATQVSIEKQVERLIKLLDTIKK